MEDDKQSYTEFASVYDILMDDTPYQNWCDYLTKRLQQYGISSGLVLDLGCGTGTMTEMMAARGYDMIGIDASIEMLSQAMHKQATRKETTGAEASVTDILYLQQDMREFELYGTVAAIYCICDSINYLLEEEEVQKVFELVHNYLDFGGLFFMDFNTPYKYETVLGDDVIAENREECSFIWENYYDVDTKINEYDLTIFMQQEDGSYRKHEETHWQRGYEASDIEHWLQQAGMDVLWMKEDYSGRKPSNKSERICIVARKEKGKA